MHIRITKKLKNFLLDIDFRASERLAILGPSGCGKSMTLKCIAGIVTPDQGQITLNGRVLFDKQRKIHLKTQSRKVGFLFQDYALFPTMDVLTNISCALSGSKKEKKEKANEMAARFRLQGLEKHYPHQLSGGQQQRTALARAMACEPDILLLDEPFSALDVYLKKQIQSETLSFLEDFPGEMIMVTHDPSEAALLCKHTLVLDNGQCVASGDANHLSIMPEKDISENGRLFLSYMKKEGNLL